MIAHAQPTHPEILTDKELIDSYEIACILYRPVSGEGLGQPLDGYQGSDRPTIDAPKGPYPIETIGGERYFKIEGKIGWDMDGEPDDPWSFDPTTNSYHMRTGDLLTFNQDYLFSLEIAE